MNERRLRPHISRPPARTEPPQAVARGQKNQREDSGSNRLSPRELGASVIGRVLILDEDSEAASMLADALATAGHAVELRPNLESGIAQVGKVAPDVVVVDPWSGDAASETPGVYGSEVIDKLRLVRDAMGASPEVVVVTARHDVDAAVDALHRGASDNLIKPTTP